MAVTPDVRDGVVNCRDALTLPSTACTRPFDSLDWPPKEAEAGGGSTTCRTPPNRDLQPGHGRHVRRRDFVSNLAAYIHGDAARRARQQS